MTQTWHHRTLIQERWRSVVSAQKGKGRVLVCQSTGSGAVRLVIRSSNPGPNHNFGFVLTRENPTMTLDMESGMALFARAISRSGAIHVLASSRS